MLTDFVAPAPEGGNIYRNVGGCFLAPAGRHLLLAYVALTELAWIITPSL
jgi:hypothetical protein